MRVSCINWSFELMQINIQILLRSFDFTKWRCLSNISPKTEHPKHSDLNDQNLFQFTMPGVSKNLDDQTEVHSGKLER